MPAHGIPGLLAWDRGPRPVGQGGAVVPRGSQIQSHRGRWSPLIGVEYTRAILQLPSDMHHGSLCTPLANHPNAAKASSSWGTFVQCHWFSQGNKMAV
jgi:hypothetical protein